jgi:hypothetical protein
VRAGLRGELRERGFDAVGARDAAEATRYGRPEQDRGPVGLVLVDQASLGDDAERGSWDQVRARLGSPPVVLIGYGNREPAEGDWTAVLRRPLSIGDIADYVERLIPTARSRTPLDR